MCLIEAAAFSFYALCTNFLTYSLSIKQSAY